MTEITDPSESDLRLARLVRLRPEPFAEIFHRARPGTEDISMSGALKGDWDETTRIAAGFRVARSKGWIDRLIATYLMRDEPVPEGEALLAEAAAQGLILPQSALQGIQDAASGFANAGVEFEAISRIIHQVCRIEIGGPGQSVGTGFLVRNDLVMTAWHVVQTLTNVEVDDTVAPSRKRSVAKSGSAARLKLVFDDYMIYRNQHLSRVSGRTVEVADDWLAASSVAHDDELWGRAVQNVLELKDCMDVAIIRLKTPMFVGGSLPRIDVNNRPIQQDPLAIYQHPRGRALHVARAVVANEGEWRFGHNVNAEPGSSGSPCFNRSFNLVGIHQAGPNSVASGGLLSEANRAISLASLAPMIAAVPLPPVGPSALVELTALNPGHPVFGRSETIAWVHQQLSEDEQPGRKPILVLHGEPGDGCSFTYEILRSLLPPGGNIVVKIDASTFNKDNAWEAAMGILNALGDTNTKLPEHLIDTHYDGPDGYIAKNLLPALIDAIDRLRTSPAEQPAAGAASDDGEKAHKKRVFIVVDRIKDAEIGIGSPLSNFLFAFYNEARANKWLAFVLLGFEQAIMNEQIASLVELHKLQSPLEDDVKAWIQAKTPPIIAARGMDMHLSLARTFLLFAQSADFARRDWYKLVVGQAGTWASVIREQQERIEGNPQS